MAPIGILLAALLALTKSQLRECNDFQECINSAITEKQISCAGSQSCANGTTLTSKDRRSGFIDCNGAQSCAFANSISANKDVNCNGKYSCDSVGSISAKTLSCTAFGGCSVADWQNSPQDFEYRANNFLYCTGEASCKWNTFLMGKRGKAACDADSSCYGTRINGGQTINCNSQWGCDFLFAASQKKFVLCGGRFTCDKAIIRNSEEVRAYASYGAMDTKIVGAKSIKAYGKYALAGARIDSDYKPTMDIQLYAALAGDGASITCRSGSTCNLYCKGGGCIDTTYQCETNATCNISPNRCTSDNSGSTINGIICPTWSFADSFQALELDYDQHKESAERAHTDIQNYREEMLKQVQKNKYEHDRKLMEIVPDSTLIKRCDTTNECNGETIRGMMMYIVLRYHHVRVQILNIRMKRVGKLFIAMVKTPAIQ